MRRHSVGCGALLDAVVQRSGARGSPRPPASTVRCRPTRLRRERRAWSAGWMLPADARYPYRQPDPDQPPGQPPTPAGTMPPWLEERLFDRRIVMLPGPLTTPVASYTAAALLSLDALGPDPVQLHLTALDGELAAAFAVV